MTKLVGSSRVRRFSTPWRRPRVVRGRVRNAEARPRVDGLFFPRGCVFELFYQARYPAPFSVFCLFTPDLDFSFPSRVERRDGVEWRETSQLTIVSPRLRAVEYVPSGSYSTPAQTRATGRDNRHRDPCGCACGP